jgi:hypothetical protein
MKSWSNRVITISCVIAAGYAMVYVDVVLRARSAYLEGEQYWRWSEHPEERAKLLDDQMKKEKAALDEERARGKLIETDYQRQLDLLQFDHEQALKESTIKYAYVWYQTAAELFTPPNSRWVRLARAKMPLAKERWIAELKSKNIPYEDYMLD